MNNLWILNTHLNIGSRAMYFPTQASSGISARTEVESKSWKSIQRPEFSLWSMSDSRGDRSQRRGQGYGLLSGLCSDTLALFPFFTIMSFTKQRLKSWRGSHKQGRKQRWPIQRLSVEQESGPRPAQSLSLFYFHSSTLSSSWLVHQKAAREDGGDGLDSRATEKSRAKRTAWAQELRD